MKIKDILNSDITMEQKLALEQVLNLSRAELLVNKEKALSKKEYKKYKYIDKQLKKGKPIQYIIKKSNFFGNDFYINNNVLIPRPETEYLVEKTDKLIKTFFPNKKEIKILDIGTGSGIIAITLKLLNKNSIVTATDISKKALKVAKKNNKVYKTEIKFVKTNLYQGIKNKYDVIISNPPYIDKESKVEDIVLKNEPHIALFANNKGLFYYEEILKNIKNIINEKHIISFETGDNQGKSIKEIAKKYLPKDEVIIEKDYNNYDRYVFIKSHKN